MSEELNEVGGEAADIDLYCLHCGYNLRGLAGDPRRCPECGKFSAVNDMLVSAADISEQLLHLESGAAMCVATAIFGPPLVTMFMGRGSPISWIIVAACCSWLWIFQVFRFRASCDAKVGWVWILLGYHFVGIVSIAAAAAGCLCVTRLKDRLDDSTNLVFLLSIGAVLIGEVAAFFCIHRWLYRRLRARMDEMRRETAVRLAQRSLRAHREQSGDID